MDRDPNLKFADFIVVAFMIVALCFDYELLRIVHR